MAGGSISLVVESVEKFEGSFAEHVLDLRVETKHERHAVFGSAVADESHVTRFTAIFEVVEAIMGCVLPDERQ